MQNALRINSTDITVANEKLKIWRRGLEAEKDGDLAKDAKQLLNKRSEEHTSELQSRTYLVCRLLLEKKN